MTTIGTVVEPTNRDSSAAISFGIPSETVADGDLETLGAREIKTAAHIENRLRRGSVLP